MAKKNIKSMMLAAGLISLALAYAFASWAIDSGRWMHYFLTFIALGLGIKFLARFIKYYGQK